MYRYTDEDGVPHLINKLKDVPKAYLNSAAVVSNSPAPTCEAEAFARDQEQSALSDLWWGIRSTWFNLSWFVRVRSGNPLFLFALGTLGTIAVAGGCWVCVKENTPRYIIIGLLLACLYLILITLYLRHALFGLY